MNHIDDACDGQGQASNHDGKTLTQKQNNAEEHVLSDSRIRNTEPQIVSSGDLAGSDMFMDEAKEGTTTQTKQTNSNSTSVEQENTEKQRFDWRITLMPKLHMFCLSIVVFSMANAVIYATLPSLGKERGILQPCPINEKATDSK